MKRTDPKTRKRADGQLTALAGEFFVAAELLKRGLQTSLTIGSAKAIDLFAFNPRSGRTFTVQVKAVRKRNYFPLSHSRVSDSHLYVFVVTNEPGTAPEYFIVPGQDLKNEPARFGRWHLDPKFPAIHPRRLAEYKDKWALFEASARRKVVRA